MNRKRLPPLVFTLLLAASAGFQPPSKAHNGVDHGNAKHQQVSDTEVILELQSLAKYKSQFGAQAHLQGTHVLTVRLLQQKQPIANAQVKAKLVTPSKQVMGSASGQILGFMPAKNQRQHYATAYSLVQKGKYQVMVQFKIKDKVSQAVFEVIAS